MADVELVIRISEKDYERLKVLKKAPFDSFPSRVYKAVANGIPLPEHHGRLIDADVVADGFEDNYELCIAVNDTPTIIPATKEAEELECDWVDCKHNDKGKCLNESVLNESCYDCYQPVTKEGAD